jgi:hypothetical protein
MYSHLSYFLYIVVAQKIKSSLMKTSSSHAGPRSSACGMVLIFTV